jgi:hypothetical protein
MRGLRACVHHIIEDWDAKTKTSRPPGPARSRRSAGLDPVHLLSIFAGSEVCSFTGAPENDVTIPLPANCIQTTEAQPDNMVKYLENERNRRGLTFKKWVICKTPSQTATPGFDFERDPRWLPSYFPGTYQFRRTVIILPYALPVPEGSPVVAEVCLMPRRRYLSQIAGQCDGKFAVWK